MRAAILGGDFDCDQNGARPARASRRRRSPHRCSSTSMAAATERRSLRTTVEELSDPASARVPLACYQRQRHRMDQSIWELMSHGGGAMWVVVAFSVIALAVGDRARDRAVEVRHPRARARRHRHALPGARRGRGGPLGVRALAVADRGRVPGRLRAARARQARARRDRGPSRAAAGQPGPALPAVDARHDRRDRAVRRSVRHRRRHHDRDGWLQGRRRR